MKIRKSKSQRGLENLIRKIVREEIAAAYENKIEDRILEISRMVAESVVMDYDLEKSKPKVVTAEDVMSLFDGKLFPGIKKDPDEMRKSAEEIYQNLNVPFGTPLYYGKGLKLQVYPEHLLPESYKKAQKEAA